ncbi:hypothetical protein JL721_12120 [Aureococcus anophagefferens]|nr:hypothetical protein JL721_12120 [Aureococcus anophagefferens]
MEDEWMEALHRYVSEGQWSEVSHFVDRNAVLFGGSSTEKEHGEGEYALYVQFRSLVAKVLDSLLEELGCRSEADEARLAIFLRETAESPASGPREEMAKRVLQDLLDIDDFAAFARTMRARNDELETGEAVELERQLSAAADAKARATPETPLGAKHSVFSDSDADLTPVTTPGGGVDWQWSTVWEEAFESAEAANDDFELQHATALSLLEAHERGALPDKDRPFVGWAQALVAVASEMNGLHWAQEPRRAAPTATSRQRFAVELRVAQEAAFEDSAARAEVAQSAAVGGDDERSRCQPWRCDPCGRRRRRGGRCVGTARSATRTSSSATSRSVGSSTAARTSRATRPRSTTLTSRAEAEAEAHRRATPPALTATATATSATSATATATSATAARRPRAAPSAIAATSPVRPRGGARHGPEAPARHARGRRRSDQAKAAAVWKLAARRAPTTRRPRTRGPRTGLRRRRRRGFVGRRPWHEFLDLDTNYCYYVNTATGESQWNPPDEFLPLDESVEVAAGLAEEQAAAYHAEAAHAAYKEELPTSEYWDEPKAAKDPPRAPEADAAPEEAKAEARATGRPSRRALRGGARVGRRHEDTAGPRALVNALTPKEPADRRPYQDSKLTKLLDGGWLDSFVVLCVFVGRETDTADAATRLKHASRLRRLSSAGPAAADAMFESLKSRAMRTKHEEETGRLKREHM